MVGRPVRLVEPVNRGGDGASQTALIAQAGIAVVGRVVEHHVPALGGDGGWHLPVEFIRAQRRFGAGWLGHQRPVRLAQFVGLDAVFIEEQEVDRVVHDDDAEVVDVARCQHPEVNDDANVRVDGQRGRKGGCVLSQAFGCCSTGITLNAERGGHQEKGQSHRHVPTHSRSISTVHFNDWV